METMTFIFKYSSSYYIITDDNLEEAWKTLASKLSMSLDRCKKGAKLIKEHSYYGFTKIKI